MGITMGKSKPPKAGFPTSENQPPIQELSNKDSKRITSNSRVEYQLCRACGGTGKMITMYPLDARNCDDCGGDGIGV